MARKKISQIPAPDRPREKLVEKGAKALTDQELMAILLGQGSQGKDVMALAGKLVPFIDEMGSRLTARDLMGFPGIGPAKAAVILSAVEFSRRRITPQGIKVRSPKDIFTHIRHYAGSRQEHFLCASLNGANEVMKVRVVSIGLVNTTQVHPREVFADPLTDRAAAVLVAHNHPSGDLSPSPRDIEVTGQLFRAGEILGIPLLDHLIFNPETYYSFKENGLMKG